MAHHTQKVLDMLVSIKSAANKKDSKRRTSQQITEDTSFVEEPIEVVKEEGEVTESDPLRVQNSDESHSSSLQTSEKRKGEGTLALLNAPKKRITEADDIDDIFSIIS